MQNLDYKNHKWQILAKDFNSPFIRNYIWTLSPLKYPELFDLPSPVLGIVSQKNEIQYIGDFSTWAKTHEALKAKVLRDNHFLENIIDKTNELGELFNKWTQSNVFDVDLSSKTSKDLIDLLNIFIEKQSELYSHGILLPILDFEGFSFVESHLQKFLKDKVLEGDYQKYFDIFTSPLNNSFAQDQEEDLLGLMCSFYTTEWIKGITDKNIDEIKLLWPNFYTKLEEHTAKHSWVYYVYSGPAFTEKIFLEFIKEYLKKNIDPNVKLKELQDKKKNISLLRESYINELNPDKFNEYILRLAGKMVWAKPRRKDYQSKSYYHLEKLQREIAKRLSVSVSQVRSTPVEVLKESLNTNNIDLYTLNSIYNFHVCLPNLNEVLIFGGKDAEDFYNNYVEKEEVVDYGNLKELKGSVAQSGKVTGIVKVINTPEDMYKMNHGDVLVSVATTPSIVPVMKKAVGIVTDEGGLTCHAAIVSRELGITCIIGTKIATKVLKDGDEVEVDANTGVVTILKRAK
jgi:phosphohistidine swiveling domain-containing protein